MQPLSGQERHLSGAAVVITRPREQAGGLRDKVHALGGVPVIMPLVEIRLADTPLVGVCTAKLTEYDVVVATSANGIRGLARACERQGVPVVVPDQRCYVMGPATAKAAQHEGLIPVYWEDVRSGADFVARVRTELHRDRRRILFVCGSLADNLVPSALTEAGHLVDVCVTYETVEVQPDHGVWSSTVEMGREVVVAFFSPSAVRVFAQFLASGVVMPSVISYVAVGPTTAGACELNGLPVREVAERLTEESVVDAIRRQLDHRTDHTGGELS